MQLAKFWMVWVVGNSGPQHRHFTIEAAKAEAERLARERTESPVVVLEVVAVACKSKPPVEWGDVVAEIDPAVSGDEDEEPQS